MLSFPGSRLSSLFGRLSRFDRLVLAVLVSLAGLTGLIIWRGDTVGLRVVAVSPAEDAGQVSTRATVRVTFDREMDTGAAGRLIWLTPPVSGTVRWEGATLVFAPAEALAPETTYRVELAAGLPSRQGRSLLRPLAWEFRTGSPRILYLAPLGPEQDQLFVVAPTGGPPQRLTGEALGVQDYALSPDGLTIAYSVPRPDGGSDWLAIAPDGGSRRTLLLCPGANCAAAAWAPDCRRLIYERRTILPGAAPGPPHLWWLELATGQTAAVFADSSWIGYGARFSPDGQWLSYVSPAAGGVQVDSLANTGDSFLLPGQMGSLAAWSPQSDALLIADIRSQGEGFAVHLFRADLAGRQLAGLSGDEPVEDGAPAWSPDGRWIAFGRKLAGVSMGRQIWLMRPDGREARYLTAEPELHYGPPEWSPDGRFLLVQRYPLKELAAAPSLWLIEVAGGRLQAVADPGSRATWLP